MGAILHDGPRPSIGVGVGSDQPPPPLSPGPASGEGNGPVQLMNAAPQFVWTHIMHAALLGSEAHMAKHFEAPQPEYVAKQSAQAFERPSFPWMHIETIGSLPMLASSHEETSEPIVDECIAIAIWSALSAHAMVAPPLLLLLLPLVVVEPLVELLEVVACDEVVPVLPPVPVPDPPAPPLEPQAMMAAVGARTAVSLMRFRE
jgi:hypothetical protein